MSELTHVDKHGKVKMVDVGNKQIQKRTAKAQGKIFVAPETLQQIAANLIKKGDVLTVAQIAAIQAAKKTAELIPLCHLLMLDKVDVNLFLDKDCVVAVSEVVCHGTTGVEMEALTAVNIALLTVYDMCKAIDKNMRISDIHLVSKVKE